MQFSLDSQLQSNFLRRKRLLLLFTALADLILLLTLLLSLSLFYYLDPLASFIWKCGLTLNSIVLLFEFRLRLTCCVGYPLKNMELMGTCFPLTRIRMKLADYLCFFYVFFCQIIYSCVLIMKRYRGEAEHTMFLIIVSLNGVFLVLWIFCTNSKSFSKFPKEKKRAAPDEESSQHEDIQQPAHMMG